MREKGIKIGIITSENTRIVENRAKKLNVDYLIQGKRDGGKLEAAIEICKTLEISLSELAFVGDDINDIELLSKVGFAFCPNDAIQDVKNIFGINAVPSNGGNGVIRDISSVILKFHK